MSRLTLIKSLVAEDNTAIKLLTSVSAAIRRYGDCVFSMERSLQAVRFRLEGEESAGPDSETGSEPAYSARVADIVNYSR